MQTTIQRGLAAATLALGLWAATTATAQTTSQTTEVRNFEVILVDGNNLVVRDELGTREITVPADFRFIVDGRSLAVSDLAAGMKGTAKVTTTTTTRPVYVTEVKQALVVQRRGTSIIVRDTGTGKSYHFNQTSINDRGIQLFLDGKPVKVTDLDAGQKLMVTFVTAAPPQVLTEKQVEAVLARPDEPVEAVVADAAGAPAEAAPATPAEAQASAPQPESAAEPQPEMAAAAPASTTAPEEPPSKTWMWLVLLAVLVVVIWLVARRGDKKKAS